MLLRSFGFLRVSRLILLACFSFILLMAAVAFFQSRADPLAAMPKSAPRAYPVDVRTEVLSEMGRFSAGKDTYGKLEWLGGLKLSSDEPTFGGFSGLAFLDPDHFLAISDRGTVLSAELERKDGRISAISEASMRTLPGLGAEMPQWRRDAEGLAFKDGEAYVSFEGDTRVIRYSLERNMLQRLEGPLPLTAAIETANRANRGLEAIAVIPQGRPYGGGFVLLSEKPQNGKILGWIVTEAETLPFTLPQSGELLAADADFTANGDLIVLERNFSLLGGLVVQLRRVLADDFVPGAIAHADLIFRANLGDGIDNMEALDIQSLANGDSLLSLMSDDNFNFLQRTLLLQFRLPSGQ